MRTACSRTNVPLDSDATIVCGESTARAAIDVGRLTGHLRVTSRVNEHLEYVVDRCVDEGFVGDHSRIHIPNS
jgi:hypothetical protein